MIAVFGTEFQLNTTTLLRFPIQRIILYRFWISGQVFGFKSSFLHPFVYIISRPRYYDDSFSKICYFDRPEVQKRYRKSIKTWKPDKFVPRNQKTVQQVVESVKIGQNRTP